MRILQLRLKNLNSLVGEWHIDFTHPAFAVDGIFAITGPTGAGKTTVLDAVCLALYGCTPRLGKVTRSGNEIMSRRTGECFAEVTFETQSGRFRCHWSQHRSRRKASGELQPARQEIVDVHTGRVIETRLSGVADQIETATGMDFDRFTRSMLLAQGGFATFLQAAADQRAPILEQITGTEIYSRISIHVHERRSAEHKKLDLISAELSGMQLLGEDDEQQLQVAIAQRRRQEEELGRRTQQLTKALAWQDGIRRLEKEFEQLQLRRQQWQLRQDLFTADRQKLQRALQALELAGEYAALAMQRLQQETELRFRAECLAALPDRQAAEEKTQKVLQAAAADLEARKDRQKISLPVIRRVRELDLKLEDKQAALQAAADALAEQESTLVAQRARYAAASADLAARRQALSEVVRQLDDSACDEGLVEHLAGICSRCDVLKERARRWQAKRAELAAAAKGLADAGTLQREKAAGLEARQQEVRDIQQSLTQKRSALQRILADKDLGAWRAEMTRQEERKNRLEKVADAVDRQLQTRQALVELDRRRKILLEKKVHLDRQLQAWIERTLALEREAQLLETQLDLLKRIQDFETARRDLRAGEPCPLCGSTAHPYAVGNLAVPDQTAADLQRVKTDLKAATIGLSDVKVGQAETAKDQEQADLRYIELSGVQAAFQQAIDQGLTELRLDVAQPQLEDRLPAMQNENREQLDRLKQIIGSAEALTRSLEELRGSLEKAKEAAAGAEREARTADHSHLAAQYTVERLQSEAATLEIERQQAEAELRQEVSVFGIPQVPLEGLDEIQAELAARRSQWLEHQSAKMQHEQTVAALAVQTAQLEELTARSAAELNRQRQHMEALQAEQAALIHDRSELFGEKHPDQEEAGLSAAVEQAAAGLEEARRNLEAAGRDVGNLRSRLETLQQTIAERSRKLDDGQSAFAARLACLGFGDEADYLAACLSEEERTDLIRQDRRLTDEETELSAARREKEMLLNIERQKELTDRSHEALSRDLAGLEERRRDMQQEIGGIQAKLIENNRLKRMQQEQIQAIELQQNECRRWDLLHELIGSADGKKYRNFAQGLTFDIMIGHANRQLCRMSDRYLLVRDAQLPLELNVIDGYQAGEIRSTKNLSGGECFIVSLALALGLSQMASRKVRVDSLFLDEGFGTLDEEALDTALETLAGLQRDGKLIGVISHLPALKERIPTQIQVVPQTGGRSIIAGPGCSRI